VIGRDQEECRTLGIESYNPTVDLGSLYSRKPSAWAWLNWDSAKDTGAFVFNHVYPRLWSPEENRRNIGVQLAGFAGIKYIVDDLSEAPDVLPAKGLIATEVPDDLQCMRI